MQLAPTDEIVMLSGFPPIRARKIRYYEDRNFSGRRLPPPVPAAAGYADRPAARPNDWEGRTALAASRPGAPEAYVAEGLAGPGKELKPKLERAPARVRPVQLDLLGLDEEEGDAAIGASLSGKAAPGLLAAAHGLNEAAPSVHQPLPSF
jgi:type IV secretion system protein VirD4